MLRWHRDSCALLFWLLWLSPAQAHPDAEHLYAWPILPLEQALEQFSRETGLALVYDPRWVAGLDSPPLQGRLSHRDALTRLLLGSGMTFRFTGERDGVALVRVEEGTGRPIGRFRDAPAQMWSMQLDRRLCLQPLTRPGAYRALLQLWIDADDRVEHTRLVATTGSTERDRLLALQLQGLMLPGASRHPMPLTFLLEPMRSEACVEGMEPEP